MALLEQHNSSRTEPTAATLETIFNAFEAQREPRTAVQVKVGNRMRASRVTEGVEACLKRDLQYVRTWGDEQRVQRFFATGEEE